VADTWTAAPPMLTRRRGHVLVSVPALGIVITMGGRVAKDQDHFGSPVDTCEIYDVARRRWSHGPKLPTDVNWLAAILLE
jgi:hypothetical protein